MQILYEYPLIIPFISILAAEFTKSIIDLITSRKKIRFINSGGMPSGHSAFVASLVVIMAFRNGLNSDEFTIATVLAVIIMYDAVNLRKQSGLHAKALNKLNNKLNLDESLGHSLIEVIIGAIFGASLSFVLLYI